MITEVEIPEDWTEAMRVDKTVHRVCHQNISQTIRVIREPLPEMREWLTEHIDRFVYHQDPKHTVGGVQQYRYFVRCLTETDAVIFKIRFELT